MPGPCIDATLIDAARLAVQSPKRAKLTVITAESCTAGLVSAALSQVDGASDVLHGSFVVYTKENKAKALGADPALLDDKSSVCGDVADRMASGALARSPAAIGLAVTGVLGPEPDEDGNPVGLVYFAICRRPGSARVIRRKYDEDDPDALRHRVTLDALQILLSAAGDS
ncbi:MAG: CinA family protein [Rhizomicrobium sp.]